MSSTLSVIICTYNPSEAIFKKCLDSVSSAAAVSPFDELVIVDNNSIPGLHSLRYINDFLSKHPAARIVVEKEQGLTPARLRGMREVNGELIVFIDDDNFLAPDFFQSGKSISINNPHVGAWSGQVKLVFEKEPEEWTKRYWGMLVYREFEGSKWSNFPHYPETMPSGAGLFIRKQVAGHYLQLHDKGKREIQLDRSANSLFSGGDNDLAACACDIGLGVGLFSELCLQHYIPANRLTKEYILKLAKGIAASAIVFKSFRGEKPGEPSLKNRLANTLRLLLKPAIHRSVYMAVLSGEKLGREMIKRSQ